MPRKYLPPVIHHYRTGSTLVVIQVLLGTVLLALAFHLLLWSPQLNNRDVPHWSGIAVRPTSFKEHNSSDLESFLFSLHDMNWLLHYYHFVWQVLLSGIFGLFLLCCCRKQYPGMRGGCCVFVVRVQYIVSFSLFSVSVVILHPISYYRISL